MSVVSWKRNICYDEVPPPKHLEKFGVENEDILSQNPLVDRILDQPIRHVCIFFAHFSLKNNQSE